MNYTYETELSNYELGRRYIALGPDLVTYLDTVIQYGNSKIATTKFLRAQLKIGLTLAKALFEERQDFLINRSPNPFGWTR